MKTTLEIPDDLMRRVKVRAVNRNQKLKDAISELLELGIASSEAQTRLRAPKPIRLRKVGPITMDDIERAIAGGRD